MNAPHRWMMEAIRQPLKRHDFEPEPPQAGEVVVEIAGCGDRCDQHGVTGDLRTQHPQRDSPVHGRATGQIVEGN